MLARAPDRHRARRGAAAARPAPARRRPGRSPAAGSPARPRPRPRPAGQRRVEATSLSRPSSARAAAAAGEARDEHAERRAGQLARSSAGIDGGVEHDRHVRREGVQLLSSGPPLPRRGRALKRARSQSAARAGGRGAASSHRSRADERDTQPLAAAAAARLLGGLLAAAAHRHRYDSDALARGPCACLTGKSESPHETAPAIRVEHELRYRAAAPLILAGGPWADLGCGNGLAAAARARRRAPAACGPRRPRGRGGRRGAAAELGLPEATQIAGDLTDPGTLERIGEALRGSGGEPVVTCFEVVEHLATSSRCSSGPPRSRAMHAATFLISVPNDAFWSIQNPHHLTAWGEGAFEELRQLLPAERTLLRQVALTGSALLELGRRADAARADAVTPAVDGHASRRHFLAAFGPRHAEVGRGALAAAEPTARSSGAGSASARATSCCRSEMAPRARSRAGSNDAQTEELRRQHRRVRGLAHLHPRARGRARTLVRRRRGCRVRRARTRARP